MLVLLRVIAILESLDGLVPETVIAAKAGIQSRVSRDFLGPRLRGDDDQKNLASRLLRDIF